MRAHRKAHGRTGRQCCVRDDRAVVRDALGVGIAVGLSGFAFGVTAAGAGITLAQTCALSLFVFTGASQFALVSALAAGRQSRSRPLPVPSSWASGTPSTGYGCPVCWGCAAVPRFAAHWVIDETTAVALAQRGRAPSGSASPSRADTLRPLEPHHPARRAGRGGHWATRTPGAWTWRARGLPRPAGTHARTAPSGRRRTRRRPGPGPAAGAARRCPGPGGGSGGTSVLLVRRAPPQERAERMQAGGRAGDGGEEERGECVDRHRRHGAGLLSGEAARSARCRRVCWSGRSSSGWQRCCRSRCWPR